MFDDYRKEVILDYEKKKEAESLSHDLFFPTPGRLRQESLKVYGERPLKKDDNTLRVFFDPPTEGNDYSRRIEKFPIDKFRPLEKLLKKGNTKPDNKNIEILAWLIDFNERPYSNWQKQQQSPNNESIVTPMPLLMQEDVSRSNEDELKTEEESTNRKEEVTAEASNSTGAKIRNAIIALILIAVTCGATYLLLKDNQKCMYWTGDHYQAISCNKKIEGTPVIALDTQRLARLKKISQPDTLTRNALGKLWYSKTDGKVCFYTSGGDHPLDPNRRLLPVTEHILEKYVLDKKISTAP